MPNDYQVGYGRPPKEGQFVKGQSGNPKGRPTGSKNMASMFNNIAREMITVTENGRSRTMTRLEAVLHRTINLALSGDSRAIRDVLRLSAHYEVAETMEDHSSNPHERDAALFQSVLARMGRMKRIEEPVTDAAEQKKESRNDHQLLSV